MPRPALNGRKARRPNQRVRLIVVPLMPAIAFGLPICRGPGWPFARPVPLIAPRPASGDTVFGVECSGRSSVPIVGEWLVILFGTARDPREGEPGRLLGCNPALGPRFARGEMG
jgi:hypothetical protein